MELLGLDVPAHRRIVGEDAAVDEPTGRLRRRQLERLEVRRRRRGRARDEVHREVIRRVRPSLVAGGEKTPPPPPPPPPAPGTPGRPPPSPPPPRPPPPPPPA